MDELMDMIGLETVKFKALELFQSFKADLERPVKSRISNKQAINFIFVGNPGTYIYHFTFCD